MRNARGPARLEHGPAERHHGALALRIEKPDRLAATRHVFPRSTGEQGRGEQDPGRAKEHDLDLLELSPARRRGQTALRHDLLSESRLSRQYGHGAPRFGKAQPPEHGHEHESGQHDGKAPAVPRSEAQPEMKTDAAVSPRDEEQHGLEKARPRIDDPKPEEEPRVRVASAEHGIGETRGDHVGSEERRHGQPQHDLGRLPGGHAEGPPSVDEPEPEKPVSEERAVERGGRQWVPPEGEKPHAPRGHGVERNQAEGVVGEVGQEICEEDEAAPQAERPDPRPA